MRPYWILFISVASKSVSSLDLHERAFVSQSIEDPILSSREITSDYPALMSRQSPTSSNAAPISARDNARLMPRSYKSSSLYKRGKGPAKGSAPSAPASKGGEGPSRFGRKTPLAPIKTSVSPSSFKKNKPSGEGASPRTQDRPRVRFASPPRSPSSPSSRSRTPSPPPRQDSIDRLYSGGGGRPARQESKPQLHAGGEGRPARQESKSQLHTGGGGHSAYQDSINQLYSGGGGSLGRQDSLDKLYN